MVAAIRRLAPYCSTSSVRQVGEVDHAAEDLQIGDQRVHLGEAGRVAVEVADRGLGIARQQRLVIGVGIGLGAQIGARLRDHLVGVGHADRCALVRRWSAMSSKSRSRSRRKA